MNSNILHVHRLAFDYSTMIFAVIFFVLFWFSELAYLLMYCSLIFSLQTPLTSILTNGFWSTLTALQCGEYSCPPLITVHLQGQKYILWDHLHFAFAKFTVVTSCWVTSIHTIIICTVKIELFLTPARAVSARRKQKWLEHWCALTRRLHKAFPSMFVLVYHDKCLWETTGTS